VGGGAARVEEGLLRQAEVGGGRRFGMCETSREFGLEGLAASGEETALRRRHALCYLGLAEKADPQLVGPPSPPAPGNRGHAGAGGLSPPRSPPDPPARTPG